MDEEPRQLALLNKAAAMLAEATSISEVKTIRDKAVAVQVWAKAAKLGVKLQNDAAEVKIRAERRAGEMLKEMKDKGQREKRGGNRKSKAHDALLIPKLDDLGISPDQNTRWQRIASVPDRQFELFISETKQSEKELTSASVLTIARLTTELHRRKQRRRKADEVERSSSINLEDCKLLRGDDSVVRLEELPSKIARIVFADPPYNLGKRYHRDKTGDTRSDDDFLAWCRTWLKQCHRIMTNDGSIFVMMNGHYAARLEIILRDLGLFRRGTIHWWENNPENQNGNFSDAVRYIHYFTRSRDRFVWHDEFRVDSRRKQLRDKRAIGDGKIPNNVWIDCRIPGNSLERVPFEDAPPQLPLAIPERCLLFASDPGDTIVDPFNGNGTTGIAALRHGRKYIGIDQSEKYLAQSRKWIGAQLAALKEAATTTD